MPRPNLTKRLYHEPEPHISQAVIGISVCLCACGLILFIYLFCIIDQVAEKMRVLIWFNWLFLLRLYWLGNAVLNNTYLILDVNQLIHCIFCCSCGGCYCISITLQVFNTATIKIRI